ncbi:MAG TPA: hypothetical protein PLM63_01640 [bacterium]|nr:hypothetical protein [bacterium]
MKIYVFDIDGNLLSIPTVFYMEDIKTGRILEFQSKDTYEVIKNMENLGLRFHISQNNSMRNFIGKHGDKALLNDIKRVEYGKSWPDFVRCVNEGSIFSIITARGNSLKCLRLIFSNFIKNNVNGISFELFLQNIKNNKIFNRLSEKYYYKITNNNKILDLYINNCCSFYGWNSKETRHTLQGLNKDMTIQDFKLLALKDFENKIRDIIKECNIDNVNEFIELGFSDDEELNCLTIKQYFEQNRGDIFRRKIYYTGNGDKKIIFS